MKKRSLLSFITLVGISPCCAAFDVSKLFMILLMPSLKSKGKLLVVLMFSRITFILRGFWYFSMAYLIVTASLSDEMLVRPSIPRFWTIFPKYLLRISTNSLSFETTLLFSTKVICKRRFYCFPKEFIFGYVFYIVVILKLLFGLS